MVTVRYWAGVIVVVVGLAAATAAAASGPPSSAGRLGAVAALCGIDGDSIRDGGASLIFDDVTDVNQMGEWLHCALRELGLPEWMWEYIVNARSGGTERFEFGTVHVLVAHGVGDAPTFVAVYDPNYESPGSMRLFVMDGHSMATTLLEHDQLVVEPLAGAVPERGDIVVLHEDGLAGPDREIVKRVIALPGETITMMGCTVVINGSVLEEPYLDPAVVTPDNCGNEVEPTVVADGTVFVMGDNRAGSQDSRAFGPVEVDSIVGVVTDVIPATSED